jgi:hypothetical protein
MAKQGNNMSHTKHGNEAPAAEREAAAAEREGLQMKAIDWLIGKLSIEEKREVGNKYFEKCDKEITKELEDKYSTYLVMKDKGYEPNDILILLEEDKGKLTGKKITTQIYSVENENEGLKAGYCILMVENIGLLGRTVK